MAPRTLAQITNAHPVADRERLADVTEAEIGRQAREDASESEANGSPVYPTPAAVRRKLKLTQRDVAALVGVPVATWRNWEQGRVTLDPAVRTLLRVLWREPDAVRRAMVA